MTFVWMPISATLKNKLWWIQIGANVNYECHNLSSYVIISMISLNYDLNMFYCMDCTMVAHFQPMGIYIKKFNIDRKCLSQPSTILTRNQSNKMHFLNIILNFLYTHWIEVIWNGNISLQGAPEDMKMDLFFLVLLWIKTIAVVFRKSCAFLLDTICYQAE